MKGVTDKDDAANFKGNLRSWQFENSVLFSVVRMIVLRQKNASSKIAEKFNKYRTSSRPCLQQRPLQISCALGKIETVPRFPGFSVFKVSLRISHIYNCKTESCNQRSHLQEVSRWNHMPRSHITSMANRITKRNADSRLEQCEKQHQL